MTRFKAFKLRQQTIIAETSKRRKEAEKHHRAQLEKEYWAAVNNSSDRTEWDYADLTEWEEEKA